MYTKYTGIILKKHSLGEADELITIYTRENGKLRVKSVSSRKTLSKLSGHLQSLNEIEFEVAGIPDSRSFSGGRLPVVISARAIGINAYLRENLRKFGFALVGIETLYRLTGDHQENRAAYEHLKIFLRLLGESSDENLTLRQFQLELLAVSGYQFPREIASPFENKGLAITEGFEQEIDRFIDYVLEREIKSVRVLDSLI